MAEPLVYILILNYRAWRDTVACLGALDKLEYPHYRVLVLDNASDNDSVAQIRAAFPGVEVLELERNLGFAGGNNVGIRRALAEGAAYVWLLNPDTLPDAQALAAMVAQAQQDAQIGAVGSVLYEMSRPEQVQAWGGGEVVWPWGLIRLLSHPRQAARMNYVSGASLLLRRAALERVGLLDEGFFMYGEDADLGLRLLKSGFKLAVAAESRVWHRGGTSWQGSSDRRGPRSLPSAHPYTAGSRLSASSPNADEQFAAYNTRLLRKHAPWPWLAVLGYGSFWLAEYALRRRWDKIGALWRGIGRGWRLPIEPGPDGLSDQATPP